MVSIRLSRTGAKKRPFYRIVVIDSRKRRDGRYIEKLGFFNPIAQGAAPRLNLNLERMEHWVSVGAQASKRVTELAREMKRMPATEQAA
ncbi:MAG: 30S ribosomal protein S16 [Legionellales bacterium]|jgi:small subunit ribosomal protein S16